MYFFWMVQHESLITERDKVIGSEPRQKNRGPGSAPSSKENSSMLDNFLIDP